MLLLLLLLLCAPQLLLLYISSANWKKIHCAAANYTITIEQQQQQCHHINGYTSNKEMERKKIVFMCVRVFKLDSVKFVEFRGWNDNIISQQIALESTVCLIMKSNLEKKSVFNNALRILNF